MMKDKAQALAKLLVIQELEFYNENCEDGDVLLTLHLNSGNEERWEARQGDEPYYSAEALQAFDGDGKKSDDWLVGLADCDGARWVFLSDTHRIEMF